MEKTAPPVFLHKRLDITMSPYQMFWRQYLEYNSDLVSAYILVCVQSLANFLGAAETGCDAE